MSTELLGIAVLLSAIAGIVISICGVNDGWAHGEAHDVKPTWTPWIGVDLVVDLGWWNMSGTITSSSLPDSDVELSQDSGVQTLGCFTVAIYVVASCCALFFIYLLAAKPCGRELELMTSPDSNKTLTFLTYAIASLGAAVLLFTIILYSSLAIGTRNAIKEKTAQLGLIVDLWPWPSWACVGGALAGICLMLAARIFQALWAETPEGYQQAVRSESFSFE